MTATPPLPRPDARPVPGARAGAGSLAYLAVLASLVVLVVARELLIPFAVAVMVWILIRALADLIGRIEVRGARVPEWARLSVALVAIGGCTWGLVVLIARNVARVQEQLPAYQANLDTAIGRFLGRFGIEGTSEVAEAIGDVPVMGYVGELAGALASLAGTVSMVVIYVLFLLVEQRHFRPKLESLFAAGERRAEIGAMIQNARLQIELYVGIKFAASALTGAASWAVLRVLEVDFAAFWGVVIFLLNFIPTIGSIFGVLLPLLLILVQFPEPVKPFVIAAIALGAIQFFIGNVLEPRWTSGSLGLSPLVLILALSAWGLMWGIVGMFLSVPLTVVLAILCAQSPRTRWIAVLLSEKGAHPTAAGPVR